MSTSPKMLQDVRERGDKARIFAPPETNKFDETNDLTEEDALALSELTKLKYPKEFGKTTHKYKSINLNRFDDLINEIGYNVTIDNNIVDLGDDESIYFKDLLDFLYDIKYNKINTFNKTRVYNDRIKKIENKLINTKKDSNNINKYKIFIKKLKNIIFRHDTSDIKESSGKGLNISSLPILLSELNIKNSKELNTNIKNLLNNLYDNKQITKLVYNNLIKAITYKNDS